MVARRWLLAAAGGRRLGRTRGTRACRTHSVRALGRCRSRGGGRGGRRRGGRSTARRRRPRRGPPRRTARARERRGRTCRESACAGGEEHDVAPEGPRRREERPQHVAEGVPVVGRQAAEREHHGRHAPADRAAGRLVETGRVQGPDGHLADVDDLAGLGADALVGLRIRSSVVATGTHARRHELPCPPRHHNTGWTTYFSLNNIF